MSDLWPIITVVGPILLLGVIAFAWFRNKTAPKSNVREAERGAKELRKDIATDPEHDD